MWAKRSSRVESWTNQRRACSHVPSSPPITAHLGVLGAADLAAEPPVVWQGEGEGGGDVDGGVEVRHGDDHGHVHREPRA